MNILCFGDSEADPRRTFAKADLLAKKQSFDCLLCLGNLFGAATDADLVSDILEGKLEISIPTYFSCGPLGLPKEVTERAESQSGQICHNLYHLGSCGRLALSEGAKLGFYTSLDGQDLSNFTTKTMPVVDILLTQTGPGTEPPGAACASQAAACALPRYHLFPDVEFTEKPPYKSSMQNGDLRLTREIALAPVANHSKSKWFYAFKLPGTEPSSSVMKTASANPYLTLAPKKRKSQPEDDNEPPTNKSTAAQSLEANADQNRKIPPVGYICKLCSIENDHYFRDCPNRSQIKKRKRNNNAEFVAKYVDPESCFFCLSNPNLARHLLVSIGDSGTYVVLPKGGMTQNHVLILPVDHKATLHALGDARSAIESEMRQYVTAMEKLYNTLGMVGVVFEISRSTGVHFHQQMMPIPKDKVDDLVDAFFAFSETENIALEKSEPKDTDENFFRVQFPSRELTLTGPLNPRSKFDLQFGRRVISDVMGVPERAHWKDCVRTDAQETADAELFKELFRPFDFTV